MKQLKGCMTDKKNPNSKTTAAKKVSFQDQEKEIKRFNKSLNHKQKFPINSYKKNHCDENLDIPDQGTL